MDFTSQPKLSKAEWASVEEPVSENEQQILHMIIAGFNNINVCHNLNQSILSCSKIEKSELIENYLYHKFFKPIIQSIKGAPVFKIKEDAVKQLKKADQIRLENIGLKLHENRNTIIEFVFLDFVKEMIQSPKRNVVAFNLYTLKQLRNISVDNLNSIVMDFVDKCIQQTETKIVLNGIISGAPAFIEQNHNLYKYGDISLFDHQKRLFSIFAPVQPPTVGRGSNRHQQKQSNLVLYIAPTGTGKTLSPIGLSNAYRVIFVCAARHIGIALAKSAISVQKCVAFAFGCETAADIRLHYYSALSYKVDKRSGGIGKVDNSVGHKVEIMICDVKSYICAMHYMISFNQPENIITYWDEPTIGMDDTSENNPLHGLLHKNWSENKIPNMVLSSATLPTTEDLEPVIADFRAKFPNVRLTEIVSHDCNKSIKLLNKMGQVVCPHLLYENHADLVKCVSYCSENKTLLRYFDLAEVTRFIDHLTKSGEIAADSEFSADNYFERSIEKIKMNSIKMYYMDLLKHLPAERWPFIFNAMRGQITKTISIDGAAAAAQHVPSTLVRMHSVTQPVAPRTLTPLEQARQRSAAAGGILITTVDAHTLTDGPTIYLAEDVDKIGQFYIQQSNIPKDVFDEIINKITHNNAVIKSIETLELELQDLLGKEQEKEKKMSAEEYTSPKAKRLDDAINALRSQIKHVSLDNNYIPNTVAHQNIWVSENPSNHVQNAYVPYLEPDVVREVMGLSVPDGLKVLLLLGIGIFSEQNSSSYSEIVKRLANNKQLFLIIATSDYIYGTNYQFCHGFLGKDLQKMTQQKTIQALGRIGRNNIQQNYTARFRDDALILNLFKINADKVEAKNMCKLLTTDLDE
jgi:hypothetical protein